jgi:hypothetical protein
MKITKTALLAALACAFGGNVMAQQTSQPSAYSYGYYADDAAPVAKPVSAKTRAAMAEVIPASCSCSDAPISSCDIGAGGRGCDAGVGDGCDGGLGGDEPWRLFQCNPLGLTIGGWSNIGYHSNNTNYNFNNYDGRVQLQQQWLYAEKIADGSCGLGFGGRIDYLYGTDAPDTQAFGIANNHWDNSWDNGGAYGHAIPQLYGEVAYGDLSVKAGHFFTIVGNEVVAATGNFFYSRQFTFYNAEPFTHTGALTTYQMDDDTTLWNGYVTGWDSGFEDNGDAYIGGFARTLGDNASFVYTTTQGRLNEGFGGGNGFLGRPFAAVSERGYVHSGILSLDLTSKLKYIAQNDYLYTTDAAGSNVRNTFGSIHYLIYAVNDKVSLGSRSEWFNVSSAAAGIRNADLYNQTAGINYRVNSNLVVRPEVRWVWDKERIGFNENGGSSQTFFGTDAVFTF